MQWREILSKRTFTKLRVSAHSLNIEIGRHNNIPAEHRFCQLCKCGLVEDEIHFVTKCTALSEVRQYAMKECVNIDNLNDQLKFTFIMSYYNGDTEVADMVTRYINDLFDRRNALLGLTRQQGQIVVYNEMW